MDVLTVDIPVDNERPPYDYQHQQGYESTPMETGDEDDGDAYADLAQWYASSLPHVHSSASFAHMSDAFTSLSPNQRPTTTEALMNEMNEMDVDTFLDDYAIELDDGDRLTQSTDPSGSLLEASTSPDDDSLLDFQPKRLRRPHGEHAALARCCDICRSDLNGKLLATCANCAFRRHLYCFSPPLQQHPALVALAHVPRHRRLPMPTLVKQWRCDGCVVRLGGAPSPAAAIVPKRPPLPLQPPPTRKTKPTEKQQPASPPKLLKPDKESRAVARPFDWHAFRADKLARVVSPSRDEVSPPRPSELAFYAPSDALLRKTARFWQQHVQRRCHQRAVYAARVLKCQRPPARPLGVVLSPREAAEVAASAARRQQQEDAAHCALFDDAALYTLNDPRPVFETLRWRPPPPAAVDVVDDDHGRTEDERAREAAECTCMEREDDDAPTPAQAERLARRRAMAAATAAATADPSLLGLALAARIIERVYVHWRGTARRHLLDRQTAQAAALLASQREHDERLCLQAEETAQRTQCLRARQLIARLRYQLRFVLTLVRAQRRVALKKQLVALLVDAREDGAVTKKTPAEEGEVDANERLRTLATRKIQRFFCRRVRRYLALKKRVMARRLVRWWRRRYYTYRFRVLALHVRSRHRDLAARCIQRTYRAFRTYTTFRALRDKHVLRRLARILRSWLLRRLARKERDRVAVLDAAVWLSGDVGLVPSDASVAEILTALGLVLYERSDFWHASVLLERAMRQRRPEGLNRATQFALAYSHHQSWYTSCDPFQLAQAERGYRTLLDDATRSSDPFVLHELALVLMHRERFGASLTLLATLIERFRDDDGFPLWLLLAGVQLAQVGEHAQSAAYLSYLVDLTLPTPYVERDVLALCAMSYEKCSGDSCAAVAAKEAWRAAVRLWTLEKKLVATTNTAEGRAPTDALTLSTNKHDSGRHTLSSQRKWELLVDLARRASSAGHFLVACRALLYALEKLAPGRTHNDHDDSEASVVDDETQRVWWQLGDAFRHVGRIELFVEAATRSCSETASEVERRAWRDDAETQARRFERELKTQSHAACVAEIRVQYEANGAAANDNDWRLEDVGANESSW